MLDQSKLWIERRRRSGGCFDHGLAALEAACKALPLLLRRGMAQKVKASWIDRRSVAPANAVCAVAAVRRGVLLRIAPKIHRGLPHWRTATLNSSIDGLVKYATAS